MKQRPFVRQWNNAMAAIEKCFDSAEDYYSFTMADQALPVIREDIERIMQEYLSIAKAAEGVEADSVS